MEIHRARQAVEKKDEQLNASRRILEAQEDELLVSVVHKINIPCSLYNMDCDMDQSSDL